MMGVLSHDIHSPTHTRGRGLYKARTLRAGDLGPSWNSAATIAFQLSHLTDKARRLFFYLRHYKKFRKYKEK